MYHVYILLCGDGTFYTGITTDVDRRFSEHRSGRGGHYTRAKGVKRILYIEDLPNKSSALRREAAIKRLTRQNKIKLMGGRENFSM
jgi:putative endonuclease